ncbi:TPA: hypothetical protein ACX6QK_003953, partial [Photobacterium damselae]
HRLKSILPPFAAPHRFWLMGTPTDALLLVSLVFPSTPLLGFTGQALLTTTDSSATSHQHQPWLSP